MPSRTTTKGAKGSTITKSKQVAPNPINERKKAAKSCKPLKQVFKGKVISSLGLFENCGKMHGPEDIAKWVVSHGGRYEKQVTEDTTHLICSIEDFKKKHPQVLAAWKLGKRQCAIVVFDWLIDCLVSSKKTCRAAGAYTLDRTIKRINQGKKDHFEYRNKFEQGVRASREFVDHRLYHVATDATGFEYKVVLSRINIGNNATEQSKPMIEKYTLYIFESHALPRLYMFGAKLTRSHRPTSYYREGIRVMEYHEAFKAFQKFFKEKTKVDWDMRCEIKQIHKSQKEEDEAVEKTKKGLLKGEKVKPFVWTPPPLGRPVGLLPWGYLRPEERESESGSEESSGSGTETDSSGATTCSSGSGDGEDVVYDTDSEVESSGDEDESSDDDMEDSSEEGPSPVKGRAIPIMGSKGGLQKIRQAYVDLTSN